MDKYFRAGLSEIQETHQLVDNEQDWIEKYRAALVQPPPSTRSRMVAAWNALARGLGLAIGKTSGKLAPTAHTPVPSTPSPERELQEYRRGGGSHDQSPSKKSPQHLHDKKAS